MVGIEWTYGSHYSIGRSYCRCIMYSILDMQVGNSYQYMRSWLTTEVCRLLQVTMRNIANSCIARAIPDQEQQLRWMRMFSNARRSVDEWNVFIRHTHGMMHVHAWLLRNFQFATGSINMVVWQMAIHVRSYQGYEVCSCAVWTTFACSDNVTLLPKSMFSDVWCLSYDML